MNSPSRSISDARSSTRPEGPAITRIAPGPRLVQLVEFACGQVAGKLHQRKYADWLSWSVAWREGERSPGACVDIANECFSHRDDPVFHTLGQLAWAAKEACYSTPASPWHVIRYVADAMIAFGVAYPSSPPARLGADGEDHSSSRDLSQAASVKLEGGDVS